MKKYVFTIYDVDGKTGKIFEVVASRPRDAHKKARNEAKKNGWLAIALSDVKPAK